MSQDNNDPKQEAFEKAKLDAYKETEAKYKINPITAWRNGANWGYEYGKREVLNSLEFSGVINLLKAFQEKQQAEKYFNVRYGIILDHYKDLMNKLENQK